MKKILSLIAIMLFVSSALLPISVYAASAKITIYVKTEQGAAVSGKRVNCSGTDLSSYEITNYSATSDSAGIATISLSEDDLSDFEFKCSISSSIPKPGCQLTWGMSPAKFTLTNGENQIVNAAGSSICSVPPDDFEDDIGDNEGNEDTLPVVSPAVNMSPISSINLPKVFTKKGSKTSDLSKLTVEDAKCYEGLVLEDVKYGRVEFKECIDLSGKQIAEKFRKLNKYISFSKGYLEFNNSKLKRLSDKKASVFLYDLSLSKGREKAECADSKDNIKKINYRKDDKLLAVHLNKFSYVSLAPNLELLEKDYSKDITDKNVKIEGTVGDLESEITISNNDEDISDKVTFYSKAQGDKDAGYFVVELSLTDGENYILVTAKSVSGKEESIDTYIPYSAEEIEGTDSGINVWVYIIPAVCLASLTIVFVIMIKKGKFPLSKNKKTAKIKKSDNKKSNVKKNIGE